MNPIPIPIPIAYGPVTNHATTHFIGSFAPPPLPSVRVPNERRDYRIHRIADHVARHFGITLDTLMLKRRARSSAWPRQIAMFILYTQTTVIPDAIGAYFGLTRCAVYYSKGVVETRMDTEPQTRATVQALIEQLKV